MASAKNFHRELKTSTTWTNTNGVAMKNLLLLIPVLAIISACSRETPPPTTPVQPPTVESTHSTTAPASEKY